MILTDENKSISIDIATSATTDNNTFTSIDIHSGQPSTDETMSLSIDSTSSTSIDCLIIVSINTNVEQIPVGVRVHVSCDRYFQELHRRVRCLAMDGELPTVRLSPYFDTGYSFELAFQCHRSQVNQHPVADVMHILLKSGQSASREEAAEKRKPRRSMQHSARRSMEFPDRGPCIFYDCVKH
ncbi:hypothetical protein F2Q68_00020428 [Brassica cretica]|uniref:Uncharacterized protein n=1 Tax=Brassica cretica TaxID=69181 RepID=A0A8S9FPM9_BRACR|nr:hypothetical protein F2Q68_00020428 [Brassica cretica]